jgi:hypothetical protein
MPKITMNKAALLYKDSSQPVADGATLQSVAGYQVKLISEVPDADGELSVGFGNVVLRWGSHLVLER